MCCVLVCGVNVDVCDVQIVGVDPVGSILALPETLNGKIESYKVCFPGVSVD